MKRLQLTAFGPIQNANITFGDLTVLVGQQATGKCLFGRRYKLIQDGAAVASRLERYGFDGRNIAEPVSAFGAHYFGSGFESAI